MNSLFSYDHSRTWCEPDYYYHTYIAEFWNTISNVILLFLSLYGIYWHYKLHKQIQKSYIICILIALGSAWYHATMSRIGQLADELPMLILCTMISNHFIKWPHLNYITTLIATTYTIMDIYAIFMVYFSIITGIVLLIPFYMQKRYLERVLFQKSIIMFVLGYTVWLIDIHACNPMIQSLYLHAWWHVFTGFALYWYIQFMMARYGRLHHSFPLEVIRINV
jgi:dihydroceramidase